MVRKCGSLVRLFLCRSGDGTILAVVRLSGPYNMAVAEFGVEGSVRLGFTARSSGRPISSCPPFFPIFSSS